MSILHPHHGILESKISLVHEPEAVPHLFALVGMSQFKLIIELGTSWGGFTVLLHEALPDAEIHTFDNENNRTPNYAWFNQHTKNITFHKPHDVLTNRDKTVVNLLKRSEHKLLYCDNGDKLKEVRIYSGFLNSGDILGAHDYGKEYKPWQMDNLLEKDFEPYYHEIIAEAGGTSRFWRRK